MGNPTSKTLTKRISASVTPDERDRFDELCKVEGRNHRQQIVYMTDQRLAELKNEGG